MSFSLCCSLFGSALDDVFVHIVTMTSQLSCQIIYFVEELILQEYDTLLHYLEVPSSSQLTTCDFAARNDLASSQPFDLSTSCLVGNRIDGKTNSKFSKVAYSFKYGHSVFQRLLLPLSGFRVAWKLVSDCFRHFFIYLRNAQTWVRSFISSLRTTLRGSSEDIGWLQRAPGVPPVKDGTTRFMELLCHASVEQNAWELKHYIEELYWGSGKRVLLLGHSKGGVDAAAALSLYWLELQDKIAGLALVQSPYAGTPVASDILRDGQIAAKEARRILELLICKVIKGDMRALEDLTYERRKEFIMNHKLPDEVPVVSFHTEASLAPGVIAMLSPIAHAEIPRLSFSGLGRPTPDVTIGRKVPVVIPLAAAMAVCALHLKLRYGAQSDGLVARCDAEVPGSVVVRPSRKLDHAWMVHSSWKEDPIQPDASEMCEALLTLLVEVGKVKMHEND